jgi:hypothetical protein
LREAHPALWSLGASALAVATGARFQAKALMEGGVPFPCLVDPGAGLHRALGLGRLDARSLLKPSSYEAHWRALRRGVRQGWLTGDLMQSSGVAVVDSEGRLAYLHRSRRLGDYPPLGDVMAAVSRLAGAEKR